uniref:Uncharacterized protein n=1 Tax=Arundo donax TaxID=35708 RepID=A0A0A8YIH9_ARUDO
MAAAVAGTIPPLSVVCCVPSPSLPAPPARDGGS